MTGGDLHDRLAELAQAEGFVAAGGVDLTSARAEYARHTERYQEWIARGYGAEMAYLERGLPRRLDPALVFPAVQSVFCVLAPYFRQPVGESEVAEGVRYARYLRGGDYHESVAEGLQRVLTQAQVEFPGLTGKVCVDTSAVLERTWAALSGLGWIGKNTLLIHPKLGSYTFIGVVLLNQPLQRAPRLQPNLCGHCSACLEACPTQAFSEPGWLDSRKCISYLTLEKRGTWTAEEQARVTRSNFVAGCDICQEVCPFNRKPSREVVTVKGKDATQGPTTWSSLASETVEAYRERIQDSALSRVKPEQFARNWQALFEAHSAKRKP